MITRESLESVFASYHIVEPPKNVIVLTKPAVSVKESNYGQRLIFYKGLQPKWRDDVIIVTPLGDDETLLHETIHAQFRTKELLTRVAGRTLIMKHRIFKSKIRPVHYEECHGCVMCHSTEIYNITQPPGAVNRHYYLVN